ncbi:MAG: hypothetical protein JWP44_4265 [Mucilaginibacter sp.]|jgi:hypothetical protein|nr:hypothetical protein [Mucilaginibacter sp.]
MEMVKVVGADDMSNTAKIIKYLPPNDLATFMKPQGAEMMRIWDARTFFFDVDRFFKL